VIIDRAVGEHHAVDRRSNAAILAVVAIDPQQKLTLQCPLESVRPRSWAEPLGGTTSTS